VAAASSRIVVGVSISPYDVCSRVMALTLTATDEYSQAGIA
jgi:hypothetical protein